uniref:Proteophosphoglycan n=1 Tax=Leishmania mexicana TaxID=5665 RepID=Q9TW13_LEIME|nr:proteophosphoglycan aPPG [Leishmania mexicana]CAB52693.1 proteophosphoglycan [Leishmania mexicana]
MAHPSHRRGTGGRHRATVMCVLFAVFFVLGDLYCTLVHAQQQVRGLAELESGSLPQAGQSLNSRYNTREAVNKEGIFGEKGLQARADHEVMNMETVAHSGATSFNWKAEDNPPIESGSSSFAATSESSAVEGSSSFHSGSGSSSFAATSESSAVEGSSSFHSGSGSSSFAATSESSAVEGSSSFHSGSGSSSFAATSESSAVEGSSSFHSGSGSSSFAATSESSAVEGSSSFHSGSGSSSFAATSESSAVEGSSSFHSGSGSSSFAATSESSAVEGSSSFHSGSGSSSFAGSSHSSSTSSSSEANKEKQPGEGVADMTLTNTVTTASSETPTAKRPAKDHGMGTALVLFFVILFIVALIMYGGRRCRSACPFVGQNGGGSGSRPYSFFQQQRLRYSTLRSDNGAYLGMEPSSVAAGVPAGGRKLGRFFQSQRGGGDNEGYSDISVELKENPKTVRGAGARRSGDAADSFSHIVDNNSATKNELFHSSASSAGPVSVQIPTQSKTSLKSLRKGKLGQVSTTPAASFFSGSTTEASGPNTRSSLYRSTADTRSGHADAAAMPPTRTQPRVENDWEW